ncbi:hypothetical protein C1I95_17630 [Micromonospora craterilacus]|uniref:ATP-grasp-modified RiPP n=1 Tax=Micromonospora craterilacus TaxID=1655439 RepID=A0A2W2E1D9_9ACTN|nr:putative ATP-grasp-modified RiPP [Micromonospora craterilacus]PZG16493.1 hypothetical protein C1I95_17630 [Micromonospora craterilacus]
MTTIAPHHTLLPLYDPAVASAEATDSRPFGLTLARPASANQPVIDLTGLRLDPTTQMVVGATGTPVARKTTQTTTTNSKTTHDHQSWVDSKQDTYGD